MNRFSVGAHPLPIVTTSETMSHRFLPFRCTVWQAAAMLILVLAACRSTLPLTGNLPIQLPGFVAAGQSLTVTVGPVNAVDGTSIGLVMVGSLGPRLYQATFNSGTAQFNIPGEHTAQAGYLTFVAASDQARGEGGVVLMSGERTQSARGASRN